MRTRATVNLGGALAIRADSGQLSGPGLAAMIAEIRGESPRRSWLQRDLAPGGRKVDETPDLDEAVALLTEAVKATPSGGPPAYTYLGGALRRRYAMTGKPKALTQALRTLRAAVTTSLPGGPVVLDRAVLPRRGAH